MNRSFLHKLIAILLVSFVAAGCNKTSDVNARYYQLKGTVISIDAGHHQIVVDHEAIPGLMGAMAMSYTVKDDAGLQQLEPGDMISARVVKTSNSVWLDRIKVTKEAAQPAAKPTVQQHIPNPGDSVPDFTFVDQDGRRIHFRRYRGRVVLLTFIYTRCPFAEYCPRMTGNFAEIDRSLSAVPGLNDKVLLLSLSFDPEHDTPKALRDYAGRYAGERRPDSVPWEFAAVPAKELKDVASFFGLTYSVQDGQIIHSLSTAVVGPDQKLFRWYHGNDWTPPELMKEMELLADDSKHGDKTLAGNVKVN